MTIVLGHPAALWALLLVPLVWTVAKSGPLHAAIRSILVALVVLALARPMLVAADDRAHHVLVVDASASVSAADRDRALAAADAWLRGAPSSVVAHVVTIGVDDGATISDGLARAATMIPDGARGAVTLVSDGRAVAREWGAALDGLSRRGIPVHAVPLATVDAVRAVALDVPDDVRVGASVPVTVETEGLGASASIRLEGPDGALARLDDVALGERDAVTLVFEPDRAGFLPIEVVVEANGAESRLARTLAVQDPVRAVYLGERLAGAAARLQSLVGPGIEIEERDDLGAPDVAGADLVIVDDRPAERLPVATQQSIVNAVRGEGLGLLVSGGAASFGPGGYHETPLADLLPVEFMKKEEKRDPSTTLVVIIDTSGSMGGNRVQLAKEVARLAIRRLLPHDKVGIVEFYGAKRWAAPIQPASNSIELERALNRLDAGGGTVILPAIEEAFYALQNVRTRYKHVLVLTDGGVETGAFEPLLRRMALKGMNVSTVLIGPDAHSEFLVSIANWGKGRFYSVPNRFNLPEILLKQPASAKLPSYRAGDHAVNARGGAGWWGATPAPALPDLAGYVEVRERPGAEVLVETARGSHPILATWRDGLGRVTALATEPTGPGTEPWREWAGYGPMLARVMTRTADDGRRPFSFSIERRGYDVTVTARRRRADDERPAGRRVDADGAAGAALEFRRRAPDAWTATIDAAPDETVRALVGADGARERVRLVSDAHADVAPEMQVAARNGLDLERLAADTGGIVLAPEALPTAALTSGGGDDPRRARPLWPWLLALALLAYTLDLVHRRRPAAPAQGRTP